jgi:hypothetical protein
MLPASTIRFAAVSYGEDLNGVAEIVEADTIVADSKAELWRINVAKALHVALSRG